jgi:hypothetical protein
MEKTADAQIGEAIASKYEDSLNLVHRKEVTRYSFKRSDQPENRSKHRNPVERMAPWVFCPDVGRNSIVSVQKSKSLSTPQPFPGNGHRRRDPWNGVLLYLPLYPKKLDNKKIFPSQGRKTGAATMETCDRYA